MYSNSLVCRILKYIDNNINSKISIDDLENQFFYNRFYIMKLFKKEFKITLIEYINSLRIYNSIMYIKEKENTLLAVAYKNGFYSLEYFSEVFKKIVGVNPMIVKKYFKNRNSIGYNNIEKINSSIVKLYNIKVQKEAYLLNQKPQHTMTKKLSIFK